MGKEEEEWTDVYTPCGKQKDGWSCGVFVCMVSYRLNSYGG